MWPVRFSRDSFLDHARDTFFCAREVSQAWVQTISTVVRTRSLDFDRHEESSGAVVAVRSRACNTRRARAR